MTMSIRNPKPVRYRLIAGRGSLGDVNWGAAGRDIKVLKEELAELKKHIGERVLVTGGGGPGGSVATLKGARIVKEGYIRGKPGLSVVLTNIDPKYSGYKPYGKEDFSPWIDSWQISVPVKNPLMPEKIRGQLKWTNIGSSLVLSRGGIVVAQWDPYVGHGLPRGVVSIYGEPEGKTLYYKTWPAWKRKIQEAYGMTPPASYVLNPRGRRRARFIHVPSGRFLPHIETSKLVSRKRAIRYRLPVMAASNPAGLMKYIAYKGTQYEKEVMIPETKRIGGKVYELAEVFPNYGSFKGHSQALGFAAQSRAQGLRARVEAHSGYTVIYVRR